MGRRRYRKQEDDGLAGLVVDLAYRSAWGGAIATSVLLVAGLAFQARPKSLVGVGGVLGSILLLCAAITALVTVMGVVMRLASRTADLAGETVIRRRDKAGGNGWGGRRGKTLRASMSPPLPAAPVVRVPAASPPPPPPPLPPARAVGSMLSRGEMAFYDPLRDIVAGRFEVHVKPSLVDVLGCRDHPDFKAISAMHVDFLLCDRATLRPRLAIELDDASHRAGRRADADRRKAELLRQAGIPLLRQPCRAAYDMQELRETIDRAIR